VGGARAARERRHVELDRRVAGDLSEPGELLTEPALDRGGAAVGSDAELGLPDLHLPFALGLREAERAEHGSRRHAGEKERRSGDLRAYGLHSWQSRQSNYARHTSPLEAGSTREPPCARN